VRERVDPPLEPVPSTLTLPLSADLTTFEPLVREAIEQQLALEQKDWTRVTDKGDSPEIETRMHARLEPPALAVHKGTLRIAVEIAYWGDVRGRAKTPFGWIWLTRSEDWGTKAAPGRIKLTVSIRPRIGEDLSFDTHSELEDVVFDAPPGEKLCTDTLIRVCISREEAAARVHKELGREIRSQAPALLRTLDARIEREVALRPFVSQALKVLASPDAHDLSIRVRELALGPLGGKRSQLRMDAELGLVVELGAQRAHDAAIPPVEAPRGRDNELVFDAKVGYAGLGEDLTRALGDIRAGELSLRRVAVPGAATSGGQLMLALTLQREQDALTVYATAEPQLAGDVLTLASVQIDEASRAALLSLALSPDTLASDIERRARVLIASYGAVQLTAIEQKLSVLTLVFVPVTLELVSTRFSDLRFTRGGLLVRVHGSARARASKDDAS
jgi:hypothetical protein